MANRTGAGCEFDRVLAELERATLELARCVGHRDPSFAAHVHARAEAVRALEHCSFDQANAGQLTRLRAVSRLGATVEQSIRQWRRSIMADLGTLGNQNELARAARGNEPAGAILDITI
jgi:hypothetical protein